MNVNHGQTYEDGDDDVPLVGTGSQYRDISPLPGQRGRTNGKGAVYVKSGCGGLLEIMGLAIQVIMTIALVLIFKELVRMNNQVEDFQNLIGNATEMEASVHSGINGGIKEFISSVSVGFPPLIWGYVGTLLNGTLPSVANSTFTYDFAAAAEAVEPLLKNVNTVLQSKNCHSKDGVKTCETFSTLIDDGYIEDTIVSILGVVRNLKTMKAPAAFKADPDQVQGSFNPTKMLDELVGWVETDLATDKWAIILPQCKDFVSRVEDLAWDQTYPGACLIEDDDYGYHNNDKPDSTKGRCICPISDRSHGKKFVNNDGDDIPFQYDDDGYTANDNDGDVDCKSDLDCPACIMDGIAEEVKPIASLVGRFCKAAAGNPPAEVAKSRLGEHP